MHDKYTKRAVCGCRVSERVRNSVTKVDDFGMSEQRTELWHKLRGIMEELGAMRLVVGLEDKQIPEV